MREARAPVLPNSALGGAVGYTLNMWPRLRRCFDHTDVEPSNSLVGGAQLIPPIRRHSIPSLGSRIADRMC